MNQYTPQNFAQMLADPVRVPAFINALKELITPDTVVLDLGAGTGGFTLLACSLGAKKVIAVEPNEAILIAKELIKENRFEDRVEFYQEKIENLNLLPVDLIIADLRGKLPFYQQNLPIMQLAKSKFLKATGALLPSKDKIYLALCSDADLYQKKIHPLAKQSIKFSTKSYEKYLTNSFYPTNFKAKQLASKAEIWCSLDYNQIKDYSYSASVTFSTLKQKLFGFYAWFDCELTPNVSYSCGADSEALVYGSVFFPFEQEIELKDNQVLEIELSARYIDEDYIWRWKTYLVDLASNSKKILFDQSTFYGVIFSKNLLDQKISPEI